MSHDPAFDTSIPVLTEVVPELNPAPAGETAQAQAVVPAATPVTAPPAPAASAVAATPAQASEAPEVLERRAIDRWNGEQWSVLERRVTARILQQLQGRVDFVLEQRLREGIAAAVDKTLAELAGEIRQGMQETLADVVNRAVSQEIAHLQNLGK